jgi:hypothetical protein
MQLEYVKFAEDPESVPEGRSPRGASMNFLPDNGYYFEEVEVHRGELIPFRGSELRVPIDNEDAVALKEALEDNNDEEILKRVRKYVTTLGLRGKEVDVSPLEGSTHKVPDESTLGVGRAHRRVSGQVNELLIPV